jgi:hypothetical protein
MECALIWTRNETSFHKSWRCIKKSLLDFSEWSIISSKDKANKPQYENQLGVYGEDYGRGLWHLRLQLSFIHSFLWHVQNGKNPTLLYKVIKKSLHALWLQYRKLQVMFSVPRKSADTYW